MLTAIIFVVFPLAMAWALWTDLFSMTIANRVSLTLIGTFAFVAPLAGIDWSTYFMHFAAGGVVLVATFIIFAIGGMGGGDAKLMAATAVWFGWNVTLLEYLGIAAIIGGALTIAILAYRASWVKDFVIRYEFLHRMAQSKEGIPYGVALGTAGLIMAPDMSLMKSAMQSLI